MKRTLLFLTALCCAGAAGVTVVDVTQHKARMDQEEDLKYQLQNAFDAKSAPKLAEAARQLQQLTKQEEAYWSAAAVKDAVRLAKENRLQAQQIATAASGGDLTASAAAFKQLSGTCTGCHDLHPEKRVSISK